jgi:putative sterol carrier protein
MSKQTGPNTILQALEGMTLSLNPTEAKDLTATIQFRINPSASLRTSGEDHGNYYLSIADGKCEFSVGSVPDPTLTITTPADVWLKVARKELRGAIALMTGKYKASGQLGLLIKMDKLFSRQPTAAELAEKGWL